MKKFGLGLMIGALLILCGGFAYADDAVAVDQGDGVKQDAGDGKQMSFDTYVELLRTDLRAGKKEVLSKSMELTPEQEKVFWPIYNDYEHDMGKLTDVSVLIIKDYAKNFKNMTDAVASDLMKRSFKNQNDKLKLRSLYGKKLEKALGARIAARFLQVDGMLNKIVELQIDAKLPLLK
jgi:hypothetical protein